ncbi:MAG TPA: FecR family protein, partial [Opitutaceae bacterium]|nr:FecR family protein [Opitutaceae bacterium]
MNLSDKEILELNELCCVVVEGTITDTQKARLETWLAESEDARKFYVRALGLSASLHHYAGEMHAEAPDARIVQTAPSFLQSWWLRSLAAAAVMTLIVWGSLKIKSASTTGKPDEYVARITGSNETKWEAGAASLRPGEHVRRGQRLDLASGYAEITFDSGAQVVLKGPASLDINSAWDAMLRRGSLKASVPPEAIGFRVSNPSVEIVDLGTEFTMIADGNGATDVLVLKGEVEAAPRGPSEQESILLRKDESRRFANSGVSDAPQDGLNLARLIENVLLERYTPKTRYVHWSFDEISGNTLKADAFGAPLKEFDAYVEGSTDLAHVAGRWDHGLKFDGQRYVKAAFPGISGMSPRTVAFWVKVPSDAQLSEAYAMVAWGTYVGKMGSHPVHISWNRNPEEGPVGALRTDFNGG